MQRRTSCYKRVESSGQSTGLVEHRPVVGGRTNELENLFDVEQYFQDTTTTRERIKSGRAQCTQ